MRGKHITGQDFIQDEKVKENLVLEDSIIAHCVLTGTVHMNNCRIKDTICNGDVIFSGCLQVKKEEK